MIEYRIQKTETVLIVEIMDSYGGRVARKQLALQSLSQTVAEKYLQALIDHIRYVREAGEKLGVPEIQLVIHDDSKWSAMEFPQYAMNFHGDQSSVNRAQTINNFSRAWLHHMHNNPHHWQYWIFPDGYTPNLSDLEGGIVQMPDKYALEMIADWMGASMAYTESWDMTDWLNENIPRIKLHSKTALYVRQKLDDLGYSELAWMLNFGHEH